MMISLFMTTFETLLFWTVRVVCIAWTDSTLTCKPTRIFIILRASKSVVIRVDKREVSSILTEASEYIPDGPYAIRSATGEVFAVSKLFDDTNESFIGGSVKCIAEHGSFAWLNIEVIYTTLLDIDVINTTKNRIAVPSKLYHEVSPARSLSGVRYTLYESVLLFH